jgi:hypothetical protein
MAVKTFGTEVLTSADTNTYLANSGLVYIAQATIGSNVSSVDLVGCFSSTYDSYYIVVANSVGNGANAAANMTLLSGTTPITTGCYGNTFYVGNSQTGAFTNSPQVNSSIFEGVLNVGTNHVTGEIILNGPFLAKYTTCTFSNVDEGYWRMGAYVHRVATSYNGFRFTFGSNTLTGGTATVYGFRKA